jgi:hypothetical protein
MLTKFYWSTIRKCIVAFGNMFNNITFDRLDTNDNPSKSIRVPLAYAPKHKYLARIDQQLNPAEERNVEIILPRMSFEMVGISYDSTRKLSLVQQNRITNSSLTNLTTQYTPSPYNIEVNLYIYARNIEDAHQIVEQILPYFNPDFNLTVKAIPELNIVHDMPIVLNGIQFEDTYEGDFNDRRMIVWTLSFTIKTNFYGPTARQGLIRTAIVNYYSNKELTNAIGKYSVTVSPSTAQPGDEFEFVETFEGLDE